MRLKTLLSIPTSIPAIAWAALAALLLSGAPALSTLADEVAYEAVYEDHVEEWLRNLVTEEDFHHHLARMQPVRELLGEEAVIQVATSPCADSLTALSLAYFGDPAFREAFGQVVQGFQDPPPAYGMANPWKVATTPLELLVEMVAVFADWCVFLPRIQGDQDNGLQFIQHFAWFYYRNPAGVDFVQGRVPADLGLLFTEQFSDQRGAFLDAPASTAYVAEWLNDPRIEIEDYQLQEVSDYHSWNDFFSRQITIDTEKKIIPSRPATMPLSQYPERDYIVVSPTDCIMNPLVQVLDASAAPQRRYLENPLQEDTVLDVKGIPISLSDLLAGVPDEYRQAFVGGTGLSCVLMPNTYHHFHAPVNGTVVHAAVLDRFGTYGYSDWPNWVPTDGNVGRPGTDFSQFQLFERGVIILEVTYANVPGADPPELTGYVASIPVGLDTIGSVQIDEAILNGADPDHGIEVKRGYTRLGGFLYGGSLDILLFSKGLATGAVQTRLGNQIGILNIGQTPQYQPPPLLDEP